MPQPYRILFLGDSITQGRSRDPEPDMQSYRYPLWKKLADGGYSFEFVGSLDSNFESMAEYPDYKGRTFDRKHEGHWGWSIDEINRQLAGWLEQYTPDMALIMLGTNDIKKKTVDQMIEDMKETIGMLRIKNPRIAVLLGLPFQEWDLFPEVRLRYTALAGELSAPGSPVIPVDHSPGWVSDPDREGTCTYDWVHTSRIGEEKLAANWFEAIKSYFDRAMQ